MSLNTKQFNYINCGICGEITSANLYGVCDGCMDEDRKLFEMLRNTIGLSQHVTFDDIRHRTGIPAKTIQRWIDTGRFKLMSP